MMPSLIIADEAISALDVSIQAQIINLLIDLKEKYNLSILFIAHDLKVVQHISDKVLIMHKGKVVEQGKTNEVFNNPLHPYTKTIIQTIPTINNVNKPLNISLYDEKQHLYNKYNKPSMIEVNQNHSILATQEELNNWKK